MTRSGKAVAIHEVADGLDRLAARKHLRATGNKRHPYYGAGYQKNSGWTIFETARAGFIRV